MILWLHFLKTALIFKIYILNFCEQNDKGFVLKKSSDGGWGEGAGAETQVGVWLQQDNIRASKLLRLDNGIWRLTQVFH